MEYNIWLDFCAILILLVILMTFHSKNSIPIFQNKIYAILVWLILLSTLCDFISGVWQNNRAFMQQHFSIYWLISLNYIYFLTRNATPFIYAVYIIAVLNIDGENRKRYFSLFLPIMLAFVLIAITPFTHAIFYMGEDGSYHRGDLLFLLYLIAVYYLGLAIIFVIKYRKAIPKTRRLSFYCFVIIALLSVLIQGRYPTLLVEGFGSALCVLAIYLTIQKPEELLYGSTGMFNQSAFLTMLSIYKKQKSEIAVIVLLFENYQILEESFGKNTINELMTAVASYLRRLAKKTSVYRIRKDRICLLLNHFDQALLSQYISSIRERFIKSWEIQEFHISLDAEFCLLGFPQHADTPEKLMDLIDLIASESKRQAGILLDINSIGVLQKQSYKRLEDIVKNAVDQDLLEVVYQPIYSPIHGRFISAEALLRLKDPELGYIPPDVFIPIAEKNGAIMRMGQFVLETVCKFIAQNQISRYGIDYIEINMSMIECLQDNLVDNILRPLRQYGLSTSQINLELTESMANTLPETVDKNLNQLVEQGLSLSLDDFGTGYSNITRMLSLPLDIIKLDKSIVQAAFVSESANIVLTTTVQMFHHLHKKVLAEGVETLEQANRIIALGCEYIQGYYYSKPLSKADFLQRLITTPKQAD